MKLEGLLTIIVVVGAFFWIGVFVGIKEQKQKGQAETYKQGYSAGLAHLKSISELQEAVGAEPDGVWGSETDRLYKEAYNNQEYKLLVERMAGK